MSVKIFFRETSFKKAFWLYFFVGNIAFAVVARVSRYLVFASDLEVEVKLHIMFSLGIAALVYNLFSVSLLGISTKKLSTLRKNIVLLLLTIYILLSFSLLILFSASSPFSFLLFSAVRL